MRFRDAQADDDAQLTRLMAKPMPGALSLAFTREPSYLRACSQCGPKRKVLTAVDGDRVLALCSYFSRPFWVAGKKSEIVTVGDFRARDGAANRGITGLGWQALRERLQGTPAVMSVVDDNHLARRLFSKVRKGWPRLHELARLQTLIYPVAAVRPKLVAGWVQPDMRMLLRFLNERGRRGRLAPVVREVDFGQSLPNLEDFVAVSDGADLTACGALWSRRDFRQISIASYGGHFSTAYQWSQRFRLGLLPTPGSEVSTAFACFVAGEGAALRVVMECLMERARQRGVHFLLWGADLQDRAPGPSFWFRFRYSSTLFQLLWDEDQPLASGPSGYEVAWL